MTASSENLLVGVSLYNILFRKSEAWINQQKYTSIYSKTCVKLPLKNGQNKYLNDKW